VTRFTIEHDLDCSAEQFWSLYLDPGFTREMIESGLGFRVLELGSLTESGTSSIRLMRVTPRLDLPEIVASLLGKTLSYQEEGRYESVPGRWTWNTRLAVLGDKIRLGGRMEIVALPDGRCRRVTEMWVDAKIFGVGGLVEKAAEKNMRAGWTESARWMNGWLALRGRASA
jgi:hypothetical protein